MDCYVIHDNPEEVVEVWRLAYQVYMHAGYCSYDPLGLLRHYRNLDNYDHTWTVMARDDAGALIGTNSISLDGPRGLHVDHTFKSETDVVRGECRNRGRRLGAAWRMAIVGHQNQPDLVLRIIDKTFEVAIEQQCIDTMLYAFHPRHTRFYQRVLGFSTIAGPTPNGTVQQAPAVLMRSDSEDLRPRWKKIRQRLR